MESSCHFLALALVCFIILTVFSNIAAVERKHEYKEECILFSDCRTPAYYCGRNKTCECAKNYIPNTSRTMCVGAVGEKCRYDDHCVQGAYCFERQTCKCKEDLYPYPSEDGFSCTDGTSMTSGNSIVLGAAFVFYLLLR